MIVSCGEALVDLVPEPVPGGGPMNVAVAAARLGAPSAFVGRVSTDAHGEAIWAHLESNRVGLTAAERGPEPTARAMVEHAPRLSFRFEGDGTADTLLTAAELDRLSPGPHLVHGGTLGMFRGSTADVLADLAESHEGIVSVDPNVRPAIIGDRDRWEHYHRRWSACSHVYRGSDEDLDWIWPGRTIDSCAEELMAGSVVAVLATHGGDGVSVYASGERLDIPGRTVDVVDTVGAGDTFVGSVLVSLWNRGLAGDPAALGELGPTEWTEIASTAVAASAITCSRRGADPPTLHVAHRSTSSTRISGSNRPSRAAPEGSGSGTPPRPPRRDRRCSR